MSSLTSHYHTPVSRFCPAHKTDLNIHNIHTCRLCAQSEHQYMSELSKRFEAGDIVRYVKDDHNSELGKVIGTYPSFARSKERDDWPPYLQRLVPVVLKNNLERYVSYYIEDPSTIVYHHYYMGGSDSISDKRRHNALRGSATLLSPIVLELECKYDMSTSDKEVEEFLALLTFIELGL